MQNQRLVLVLAVQPACQRLFLAADYPSHTLFSTTNTRPRALIVECTISEEQGGEKRQAGDAEGVQILQAVVTHLDLLQLGTVWNERESKHSPMM